MRHSSGKVSRLWPGIFLRREEMSDRARVGWRRRETHKPGCLDVVLFEHLEETAYADCAGEETW